MGGLEGGKKLRRLSDGLQLRYAQLLEFANGELRGPLSQIAIRHSRIATLDSKQSL